MFEHRLDQPSGPASTALRKMRRGAGASFLAPHSGHYEGLFIFLPNASTKLRILAPLPTTTPEFTRLCALPMGSIVSLPLPISGRAWRPGTRKAQQPPIGLRCLWHWHSHVMAGCARIPLGMPGPFVPVCQPLIDGTLKGEQSIPERETSCLPAAITGVGTPSMVGTSA